MAMQGSGAAATPRAGSEASAAQAYLLLALASLTWSGNHIVGRAFVGHDIPPVLLSLLRWTLPLPLLWWLARPHFARDWPLIRQRWPAMTFLAVVGWAMFAALQYKGLELTTALNVSVMNSIAPVLIFAAGAVLFGDRLTARQGLGIAASLAGVLVIVTRAELDTLRRLAFNAGDLIIFLNMGLWGVYSACLRLRPAVHWLSLTLVLASIAAVATLPFAVLELAGGAVPKATAGAVIASLYVAFSAGLVGMAAWNRGVEIIGAPRAGAFLHLIPIYSAVLAWALLGERLMGFHIAGFALIVLGVWLAARR